VVEIIRNQLYNLFRALTREYGLLITIMRWQWSRRKITTCRNTKKPQDEHVAGYFLRSKMFLTSSSFPHYVEPEISLPYFQKPAIFP
jgi:hypothetical protein